MTDDRGTEDLAPYLHTGAEQRRLLELMDRGHARIQHGKELGNPTPEAFMGRIARHLRTAPEAYAVDSRGFRCYLLVDRRSNQVAWIPPHKEHRATFFRPDNGVAAYLAAKRGVQRGGSLARIDIVAIRLKTAQSALAPSRAITSRQRQPRADSLDR